MGTILFDLSEGEKVFKSRSPLAVQKEGSQGSVLSPPDNIVKETPKLHYGVSTAHKLVGLQ